jgi:hypothetical protein
MSDENIGDQFKGIAGAQLLNDAFDGIVNIARHFTEPEDDHIFKGIKVAAAHMGLAVHKHNGEVYDGDDPVSKMSIKEHLHQSHLMLMHHLPNKITDFSTPDYKGVYDGIINDYDTKRINQDSLSKEGKEIQRKYAGFVSNIREYNNLMGNK